ncbi:hypothetical protein G9274_002581 [Stenotrophomonas rhizophila]|nr:hypothetical protein G9274_002581 [Stenotrophomonas rhizophila]
MIAVDGLPVQQSNDQVEQVGILFGTSQVPEGIRTTAHATLQGEHLAQIRLSAAESASPAREQAIIKMLREKFGAPRQDPTSAALIWTLPEMTIFSHPAERGNPAEVTATSNTFLRAIQQQHLRDHATSF